ncbi:MAG: DUF1249 domain-containing protein [Xanthomonadaceae bacterium]|jgi:uncharacterized protein YqiB (DUF1249 family)|nr:DUF1249 domain-containing protein [Xanthomonadaceae bacterium]
MQQVIANEARAPRLSRFGWLMALYAENYCRIGRLFAPADLGVGHYVSRIGDGLDLYVDILERHRYTVEMRLTYGMRDPVTGESDPSAYMRLYCDARQVETTHCYVGRRWQDAIGLYPPPAELIGHRLRMNTFLGKWLEYLAELGHGVATLSVAELRSCGDVVVN